MARPRVIIADTDENYIVPLQLKFVNDFSDKIDLEIITDAQYFNELFMSPQRAEVLIVSQDLYDSTIQRHNINNIFLMMEQYDEEEKTELNLVPLFKYTSIKEIFNEIIGRCADDLKVDKREKKESQLILVTSASGGVGKTTVALGMSMCLTQNYKRVLYINADRIQSFQFRLDNPTAITSPEIYTKLSGSRDNIYAEIKHLIRKETFNYVPPFKAALMSLGLEYSIYERLAVSAKESGEYDYIIVDAESTFDEDKAKLLDLADKVVIITNQSSNSVYATNALVSNINITSLEKYVFICNDFDKGVDNALISSDTPLRFSVNDYIGHFNGHDRMKCKEIAKNNDIQKTAFLII